MAEQRRDIRLFERAAEQRLSAAQLLFDHGYLLDATYLAGYSVECALKALILRRTPKNEHAGMLARLTEVGVRGHDFEYLKQVLKERFGKRAATDRKVLGKLTESLKRVALWSTELRYQVGDLKNTEAVQFLAAAREIKEWCLRS